MVEVATQVAKLRQESGRLRTDWAAHGVVLVSDMRHATAAKPRPTCCRQAGYLLAHAELERTVGRAPGLGTP
jgi:hypothetical protein